MPPLAVPHQSAAGHYRHVGASAIPFAPHHRDHLSFGEMPSRMRGPPNARCTLSWDQTQVQFGLGAGPMSQGSDGSAVNLIENDTCNEIFQGLKGADGSLPNFERDAGRPAPELEAAVMCDRATQTSPTQDTLVAVRTVQDAGTQVGQATVADQCTQVLSRPNQSVS